MKSDPKILLGRILQIMIDRGYSQVKGYKKFTYIKHYHNRIEVGREDGQDTEIHFKKILKVIKEYQKSPDDYNKGPIKTRDYGITHVNSPIWSMVHLLDENDYEK